MAAAAPSFPRASSECVVCRALETYTPPLSYVLYVRNSLEPESMRRTYTDVRYTDSSCRANGFQQRKEGEEKGGWHATQHPTFFEKKLNLTFFYANGQKRYVEIHFSTFRIRGKRRSKLSFNPCTEITSSPGKEGLFFLQPRFTPDFLGGEAARDPSLLPFSSLFLASTLALLEFVVRFHPFPLSPGRNGLRPLRGKADGPRS